ncbi:hypothetical protein VHA_001342 [Grimontia hollisae CIP 101886]|uniref:Uncharacterized protein n=1 Tax=Grimontia hollisae CIP 101886 TaxID=675812 RepID=D0I6H5_GRIHO|nr:hypothetical protein VHA_001342 [Grimontia hollisae CIP 101886]
MKDTLSHNGGYPYCRQSSEEMRPLSVKVQAEKTHDKYYTYDALHQVFHYIVL